MKKCVKVVLSGVCDAEGLCATLRQAVETEALEGVVEQTDHDVIELIVHGTKDRVDEYVGGVEYVALSFGSKHKCPISFAVEPFYKDEDYRGVLRFLKRGMSRR
jgi:hypothetical protein